MTINLKLDIVIIRCINLTLVLSVISIKKYNEKTYFMFALFCFILIFHIILSFLSWVSFYPSHKKNRSYYEIIEDEKYDKLFRKNFPFLSKYSGFLMFTPIVYFFIYCQFSRIDFAINSRNIVPILLGIMFALIPMFFIYHKVDYDYQLRDKEMRKKNPNIGLGMYIFAYSISVVLSFSSIHFLNYSLDFSQGEENNVVVNESKYYTTHSSKGGTTHHYKISFYPDVGGLRTLEVPSELQSRTKKDDKLILYLKKGFFGLPYISSSKILVK